MSKDVFECKLKPVTTNLGNTALNNICLSHYIRNYGFDKPSLSAVCYTIASYRNNTTSLCSPGSQAIAHGAGCTKRTVERALEFLVLNKVLIIVNNSVRDGKTTNKYYFTYDMETLQEMVADTDHEIHKTNEIDDVKLAFHFYKTLF